MNALILMDWPSQISDCTRRGGGYITIILIGIKEKEICQLFKKKKASVPVWVPFMTALISAFLSCGLVRAVCVVQLDHYQVSTL
jgi:hypothetical protein